jgi:hypothetical protein
MRIQDLVGDDLEWAQSSLFSSEYELTRGTDLVGTLKFRSVFGTFATATVDLGCWTFKRMGFLKTRVTIMACGEERELGLFQNNTWSGGGTLELPGGRHIKANTNFWHSKYEFTNDAEPLIRYRTRQMLKLSGHMEILRAATALPELPWLMMLGWYLAVMMHRDDSAAATVMPS